MTLKAGPIILKCKRKTSKRISNSETCKKWLSHFGKEGVVTTFRKMSVSLVSLGALTLPGTREAVDSIWITVIQWWSQRAWEAGCRVTIYVKTCSPLLQMKGPRNDGHCQKLSRPGNGFFLTVRKVCNFVVSSETWVSNLQNCKTIYVLFQIIRIMVNC